MFFLPADNMEMAPADIMKHLSVDFSRPSPLSSRIIFSEDLLQCYPSYLSLIDYA